MTQGKIDFRLKRILSSFLKQDPPPNRIKPIPVQVLCRVMLVAYAAPTPGNLAITDMCCIAFFFLLRPREYMVSPGESTPFRLCNVQFQIGTRRLNTFLASDAKLRSASFATLTFTTQKNGVRGKVIGLGRSGHAQLCPVISLCNRVLHACAHSADPAAPHAAYYSNGRWSHVTSSDITTTLQLAVTFLGPTLGFVPTLGRRVRRDLPPHPSMPSICVWRTGGVATSLWCHGGFTISVNSRLSPSLL
jgi:hypothetical protein